MNSKTKRIQIKDLQIGQKIKTLRNNKIVYEEVTDKFDSVVENANQFLLEFENGSTLNCSNNHPIIVFRDSEYVEVLPEDLTVEDKIPTENGTLTRILNKRRGQSNDVNYIDITVNKTHTFFCANAENDEMILTHNSQGGIRDGSATTTYDIFHPEIMDILVLKNNKGTEDNRVKQLDYCIKMSKLLINRMIKNEKISLFSSYYAPELYESHGDSTFDEKYLAAEASNIPRKEVKGLELLTSLVTERIQTGRIYYMFADNVNSDANAFLENISTTNLCTEIVLPTTPIYDINDEEGEIALCMLAGYNLGVLDKDFSTLEKTARYNVRALDNIMNIQEYPVAASKKQLKRRSIGIGVTNFAYWMAKKGLKYDDPAALPEVDRLFEAIQFYTLKASMELAKERGACEWFHKTKYSKGWLPIDKERPLIKELTGNRKLELDWEWLRTEISKYGLRNSVVTALMPVESSSLVTDSTNGIDVPVSLISYKKNKTINCKFVVPGIKSLKSKYTLAWDIRSNDCINKLTGIMQYWIDQAISTNHYYNPMMYEDKKIPINVVVKDVIQAWKLGIKNLYYARMMDNISADEVGCDGGGCVL